ncbi:MAG TPA: hypothetical protein VFO40_05085 [Chthoniobacterales bacterium]|nr:hypothetical protein [Chthoniobacterales bacterium]
MIQGWEQFARQLAEVHGEAFVQDFCRTLSDEARAEEELAFARQREIAAASERLDAAWFDGLGECHMSLDPEVFFHWIRKEGRDCWNDASFIREFKRDNPEVIVRNRSRKSFVVRP